MPRPQFTLRALLVAMLVVGAFFGGIRFERNQRALVDRERQAVQQHERALLDYQESLRDYANHLRDPSGEALFLPYADGWSPDPKTGLPLPPSQLSDPEIRESCLPTTD